VRSADRGRLLQASADFSSAEARCRQVAGRSPGGESGDRARIGVVEERHDRLVHAQAPGQTQVVAPLAKKRNAESGKYGRFAFTRGSVSYMVKLPATIFGEDWVVLIGNSGVDWKQKSFRKRCQRLDRRIGSLLTCFTLTKCRRNGYAEAKIPV
jgi:hypothetical protein